MSGGIWFTESGEYELSNAERVEAVAQKLFQSAMDEPWEGASPEQDKQYREMARAALASTK